jgi:hypothetical protein
LNVPISFGRGTGTLTDSSPATSSFIYYVVDANNIRFLSSDLGIRGLGRAERQTGAPFSNASLSGGYAFGSLGDSTFLNGVNTVGRFTAGGDGTVTAGVLDSVKDGVKSANVSFTGSYTMAATGRTAVTFNTSTGTIQEIFWMVSPSRAFFLIDDLNKVEDGTLDLQQSSSFSNSTMNGQFAIVMDGFDLSPVLISRVGTLQWDGSGNLILNEFVNFNGTLNTAVLSGTYSVAGNGRTTGTIGGISNNLVFYLISGSDAYFLLNDTNVQISGVTSKQP